MLATICQIDAQNITGTITDENGQPMEFVTVSLRSLPDYGNFFNKQSNDSRSPCLQLRLSYRFNAANSKYKGTGAGQDAKNRM